MLDRAKLADAFDWFEKGIKAGVLAANNTSMEWDDIRAQFYKENNAVFWMYGIWDLGSVAFPTFGLPKDEATFFKHWGWVAAAAGGEGRQPEQPDPPRGLRRVGQDEASRPRGASARLRLRPGSQHRPRGHDDASRHQAGAA